MGQSRSQFGLQAENLLDQVGHGVGEEGEDGVDGELGGLLIVVGVGANIKHFNPFPLVWSRRGGVGPGAFGG